MRRPPTAREIDARASVRDASRRPSRAIWARRGRERRLQPPGPGRRARLARGRDAARLLQVSAPGRDPLQPGLYGGDARAATRRSPRCSCELFRARSIPPSRRPASTARVKAIATEIEHALDARHQPRRGPHPAPLPQRRSERRCAPTSSRRRAGRRAEALPLVQARLARGRRAAAAAAAGRDLRLQRRASRRSICAAARWRAAASAGPTGARISAPRSSA